MDFIDPNRIDETFEKFVVVSSHKSCRFSISLINCLYSQPVILNVLPTFVFKTKAVGSEFVELMQEKSTSFKSWHCRISCDDNHENDRLNARTTRVSVPLSFHQGHSQETQNELLCSRRASNHCPKFCWQMKCVVKTVRWISFSGSSSFYAAICQQLRRIWPSSWERRWFFRARTTIIPNTVTVSGSTMEPDTNSRIFWICGTRRSVQLEIEWLEAPNKRVSCTMRSHNCKWKKMSTDSAETSANWLRWSKLGVFDCSRRCIDLLFILTVGSKKSTSNCAKKYWTIW